MEIYLWARKRLENCKFKGYDVWKGAYSVIEYQSIQTALNYHLNELQNASLYNKAIFKASVVRKLTSFYLTLGNIFLVVLNRRPVQLAQLKWSDIIPVGATFGSSQIPIDNEYCFSDVEQLQIRMFKSKSGYEFRGEVEIYPLILDHELSTSVMIYRNEYLRRIQLRIDELGISLSNDESMEIMSRCPIFYHKSLFQTEFQDKQQLFSAIGQNSQGFHCKSDSLVGSLRSINKCISLKSDRIPSSQLRISNTRIRHTVLSNGAMHIQDPVQLSKITNVTPSSVKPYIDFSHEARVDIDTKFIGNKLLLDAFSTTIKELKQRPEFAIKDEFDQEIGAVKGLIACKDCKVKIAKPIGCYGCDNFTALRDADHQSQLEKAQIKLEINQDAGESKEVLQKLRTQIYWIKVTISLCAELITKEKGLSC